MINLTETGDQAANEFGLSLLDDKQIWDNGLPTAEQLKDICHTVSRDSAASSIARALGKLVEPITQDIDVAIAEDGALADINETAGRWLDTPFDTSGDFADMFADLKDWEAKLELVRERLREISKTYKPKPLSVAQLLAYVNSDVRLAGMGKAVSALEYEGAADVFVDCEMPPIPTKLKRVARPAISAPLVDAAFFDDDEPAPALPPVAPVTFTRRDEPASGPRLCVLASAAGIPDQDMASLLNVSKSYYSLIRSGKRPWNGMLPDHVKSLMTELASRVEIISELVSELELGDITKAKP